MWHSCRLPLWIREATGEKQIGNQGESSVSSLWFPSVEFAKGMFFRSCCGSFQVLCNGQLGVSTLSVFFSWVYGGVVLVPRSLGLNESTRIKQVRIKRRPFCCSVNPSLHGFVVIKMSINTALPYLKSRIHPTLSTARPGVHSTPDSQKLGHTKQL